MADIGPALEVRSLGYAAPLVVLARILEDETHCVSNLWADPTRNAVVYVPKGTVCQVLVRDRHLCLCYLVMSNGLPVAGWINRDKLEDYPPSTIPMCIC